MRLPLWSQIVIFVAGLAGLAIWVVQDEVERRSNQQAAIGAYQPAKMAMPQSALEPEPPQPESKTALEETPPSSQPRASPVQPADFRGRVVGLQNRESANEYINVTVPDYLSIN